MLAQFSRFISTNVKWTACKPEKWKIGISHWIHYKYNFTARTPRNTETEWKFSVKSMYKRKGKESAGWGIRTKRRFSSGWSALCFSISFGYFQCSFPCFLLRQVKRTQKFIVCNSKFDMNFIYLHVNRICVTPKTFEREIYEQTAADHLSAFPLAFPQHFLSVRVGERCSGIRSMNESENQACPSLRFPQLFVFHLESWLYCWSMATFLDFFIFIFPHRLCLACLFRPAFIILNVVGHGHVVSVRLAWFRGIFGLGPGRGLLLSRLATLVCVLLAIMPKIWLTSRLLLFIMIHFTRFYGCQGLSRDREPTEGPSDNVVRFVCHPHSLYESLYA